MYVKKRMMWTAAACCLALLLAGCNDQAGFYVEQNDAEVSDGEASDREAKASDDENAENPDVQDSGQGIIYVQVSGAVVRPGVYQLPEGSRIFEAVELAGGPTGEADLNSVNQAEALSDGQMVYLYAVGETQEAFGAEVSGAAEDDGLVNLNTASAEQLMTLPGIGQSKAASIISWREENGGFGCIEDIMNIEGIKEGVFSKIKDHIKVD